MAQHTPGPWDVSFGRNDAAIHAGGTIAMIEDVMTGWRANARLIAAAPELLAALGDIVASSDANCGDSLANAIRTAKDAIAKAKGE